MGVETVGLLGAGIGAVGSYFDNKAARKRADRVSGQASAITGQPVGAEAEIMKQLSMPNTGQDGFLQYLRANPRGLDPYMFDSSKAFKDLQANDAYTIGDQVNQLRAGAGSLGQRFGTGFASRESGLRGRFAAGIASRSAGIAQNSFNTALGFGAQGFQAGQQGKSNLLQLLLSTQLGQRGQQLQALGLGSSQPYPATTQPIGQGLTDIAQLLMLSRYLGGGAGGGGGAKPQAPSNNILPGEWDWLYRGQPSPTAQWGLPG